MKACGTGEDFTIIQTEIKWLENYSTTSRQRRGCADLRRACAVTGRPHSPGRLSRCCPRPIYLPHTPVNPIVSDKWRCEVGIEAFYVSISRSNTARYSQSAYFIMPQKQLKRIRTALLTYCLTKTSIEELLGRRLWLKYEV